MSSAYHDFGHDLNKFTPALGSGLYGQSSLPLFPTPSLVYVLFPILHPHSPILELCADGAVPWHLISSVPPAHTCFIWSLLIFSADPSLPLEDLLSSHPPLFSWILHLQADFCAGGVCELGEN